LLKVTYNDKNYFIGDLDKKIKIEHDLNDEKKLRNIEEVFINISDLIIILKMNLSKIESLNVKVDPSVRFKDGDKLIEENLIDYLKGKNFPTNELDI
jgi:CRISPR-associated protein Csh2